MEEAKTGPTVSNAPKSASDTQSDGCPVQEKPADEQLKGAPLYLRWLSLLCAFMALFCVGVFIVGYKDPSFGRVATLVALIVASAVCWWLSKKKAC